jgi:hypothetical protein
MGTPNDAGPTEDVGIRLEGARRMCDGAMRPDVELKKP